MCTSSVGCGKACELIYQVAFFPQGNFRVPPLPPGIFTPLMQQPNIVDFAVATSIGLMFFQGLETDTRVRQFEDIAAACLALLQFLGKPPYLKSVFDVWVTSTAALAALERALFPNDPVQTPGHLALPPGWRPLSAVCDPEFRVHQALLQRGRTNLENFRQWFRESYDVYLHAETLSMLEDALLIFEAVEHFLALGHEPVLDPPPADSTGGNGSTRTPVLPRRMPHRDPWNQPGV